MSVTPELLNQIVKTARNLEAQFYFERARGGDQRAASLFAKLVAYTMNPEGDPTGAGWLSKSPGESQVEGYAEDAIVIGNDPDDLENVIDLVNGAGAPGASLPERLLPQDVKPRRPSNRWVKPQPLTASQLQYLRPGGAPIPAPSAPQLPGREEMMNAGRWLDAHYRAPEGLQRENGLSINGGPDWEGVGAWLFDVYLHARVSGKSADEARTAVVAEIQKTDEWKGKHP